MQVMTTISAQAAAEREQARQSVVVGGLAAGGGAGAPSVSSPAGTATTARTS